MYRRSEVKGANKSEFVWLQNSWLFLRRVFRIRESMRKHGSNHGDVVLHARRLRLHLLHAPTSRKSTFPPLSIKYCQFALFSCHFLSTLTWLFWTLAPRGRRGPNVSVHFSGGQFILRENKKKLWKDDNDEDDVSGLLQFAQPLGGETFGSKSSNRSHSPVTPMGRFEKDYIRAAADVLRPRP